MDIMDFLSSDLLDTLATMVGVIGSIASLWIIGAIAVRIIESAVFLHIAKEKGHRSAGWFFAVFFLGLPGMLMVVALPDRNPSPVTMIAADPN